MVTVAVLGATGKIGSSIVRSLLDRKEQFTTITLTRHVSFDNAASASLRARGARVIAYSPDWPDHMLLPCLQGVEVFISCIPWEFLDQQTIWYVPAKAAGVQRFVPAEWATPAAMGVIDSKVLRRYADQRLQKYEQLAMIQQAKLPYTVIDIGCCYQWFTSPADCDQNHHLNCPHLHHHVVEGGNQPFALIELGDLGEHVVMIISDKRNLNKHVFVYTEMLSQQNIWDTMQGVNGQPRRRRSHMSRDRFQQIIKGASESLDSMQRTGADLTGPDSHTLRTTYHMGQSLYSWCILRDNTPENATYLGYLDFWELYPHFRRGMSFEICYRALLAQRQAPP